MSLLLHKCLYVHFERTNITHAVLHSQDMASELATSKEELSLLKAQYGQHQASELRLQGEKATLVEELGSLRKQLATSAEEARREVEVVRREASGEASGEAERHRQEVKTLHEELLLCREASEQRAAVLTREKNEVESDLGRRLSVAMTTVIKEQEAQEQLATELSDAGSRMEQLQKSLLSADEQLQAASVEKETLHTHCEVLKLELAAVQQMAHKREKEALEAGQARETILQERRSLDEAWHEEKRLAGVQSERFKSELEGLRLQLKASVAEKEAALSERGREARDRGALESKVLELEEVLQRRGHELDVVKERAAHAVSELEVRLQARELALESAKVERDSLQAGRDSLGSEVDSKHQRHQREVEGYALKLRKLETENGILVDARTQLSFELEQLRCAGTEAEKRLVATEKSNGELQLELQKVREQCAKSAEALNALGAVWAGEEADVYDGRGRRDVLCIADYQHRVFSSEDQDASQKEELKKLKMFVVKLKKELNEAKSKVL